jgi:hypothetical protein
MPTGYDYGSCINVAGNCYKEQGRTCGVDTWDCGNPPKTIQGDSTCHTHFVEICATVNPDPPNDP